MLQGDIVVLSSRRSASGHFRSLFTDSLTPRTFLVTFEYLWEFNSQEITGLIVNLYLNTFLIESFFGFVAKFLKTVHTVR